VLILNVIYKVYTETGGITAMFYFLGFWWPMLNILFCLKALSVRHLCARLFSKSVAFADSDPISSLYKRSGVIWSIGIGFFRKDSVESAVSSECSSRDSHLRFS
jgi:hypothetical protein